MLLASLHLQASEPDDRRDLVFCFHLSSGPPLPCDVHELSFAFAGRGCAWRLNGSLGQCKVNGFRVLSPRSSPLKVISEPLLFVGFRGRKTRVGRSPKGMFFIVPRTGKPGVLFVPPMVRDLSLQKSPPPLLPLSKLNISCHTPVAGPYVIERTFPSSTATVFLGPR